MNKVIKLIALILIISFVLDKLVYFVLNQISDKVFTGQSVGKLNEFLSVKDDKEVLVFGSSRAHHHVDINKISENGYNMGVDGRFIAYSSTLTKLLPTEKEQLIILHIDPEWAALDSYSGDDIMALSVKYHRNKKIKKEINRIGQSSVLQQFYWCLDYNGKALGILENFINARKEIDPNNGFGPITVTATQKSVFQNIISLQKVDTCLVDQEVNSLYKTYIKEIKELEKDGKRVVAITSPTYKDDCKIDNQKLQQYLKELDLPYYDFSDYFKENNNIDYWRDKTHLSKIGAEIFTASLIEWLDTLNE